MKISRVFVLSCFCLLTSVFPRVEIIEKITAMALTEHRSFFNVGLNMCVDSTFQLNIRRFQCSAEYSAISLFQVDNQCFAVFQCFAKYFRSSLWMSNVDLIYLAPIPKPFARIARTDRRWKSDPYMSPLLPSRRHNKTGLRSKSRSIYIKVQFLLWNYVCGQYFIDVAKNTRILLKYF